MRTAEQISKLFKDAGVYKIKTIKTYTPMVRLWQKHVGDPDTFSLDTVNDSISLLTRIYPQTTVKMALYALKSYCLETNNELGNELTAARFHVMDNVRDSREYVSKERLENILTDNVLKDVSDPLNLRNYLLLLTFARTGAKLEEVRNIRFEDVHMNDIETGPYICINAKTPESRIVPLKKDIVIYHLAFNSWHNILRNNEINSEFVFTSMKRHERMHPRAIYTIIKENYDVTPSHIRNTFFAESKEENTDSRTIARIMGIDAWSAEQNYNLIDPKEKK